MLYLIADICYEVKGSFFPKYLLTATVTTRTATKHKPIKADSCEEKSILLIGQQCVKSKKQGDSFRAESEFSFITFIIMNIF